MAAIAGQSFKQFLADPNMPNTLHFKAAMPDGSTVDLYLDKRAFASGGYGWGTSGKQRIGGLQVQVSANLSVVGSKNRDDAADVAAELADEKARRLTDKANRKSEDKLNVPYTGVTPKVILRKAAPVAVDPIPEVDYNALPAEVQALIDEQEEAKGRDLTDEEMGEVWEAAGMAGVPMPRIEA